MYCAKGYCQAHYRQARLGLELKPVKPRRRGWTRDANGNKQCTQCLQWLPDRDFHVDRKASDGRTSRCRLCSTARKHGISGDRVRAMLAAQKERCFFCPANLIGVDAGGKTLIRIDHDHACCPGETGCPACVRRLLCQMCNWLEGLVKDNHDLIRRIIETQEGEPRARSARGSAA